MPPEDLTNRLAELRAFLERGEGIYADVSFSLRHEIDRTKSARPGRWSKLVPAPMSEDVNGGESPLDLAWTIQTDRIRVPALMREDTTESAQPLDSAWTTPTRGVANVVPAPRLELGTP